MGASFGSSGHEAGQENGDRPPSSGSLASGSKQMAEKTDRLIDI